jgi:UDP-3-O-acyl N-acetylglucosamine deacetylase
MDALVLIVDDELGILTALSSILGDEGCGTITTTSGEEALELYRDKRPDVVFLDIWMPDRDGLETLQALLRLDPSAAVIMMSGHGTSTTAVKAVKMGAYDYLEKPLSYDQVVEAVEGALRHRQAVAGHEPEEFAVGGVGQVAGARVFDALPGLPLLEQTDEPQRTIRSNSVMYGMGLHSGRRTGMVLQPLPPDTGIHFLTVPRGVQIPAHVSTVAETDYATTITRSGESIRTVEHLLSALHAYRISNLLIKVHGEIPVLDGSSLEFCDHLEQVGVVEQDAARREIVIDRRYEVNDGEHKTLSIEPAEQFSVSYLLQYPLPVGEQYCEFVLTDSQAYREQIAPARTFGFMRDIKMINELGLGSGGRLDNFILVGEDNVINTELRFPDEFVRHKILDIIGDLYLLGYPIRGRVSARLTGHRDNIALQRKILEQAGT